MLAKIDPEYFVKKVRLDIGDETVLCTKTGEEEMKEGHEESAFSDDDAPMPDSNKSASFGTVTEFFFMLAQGLHVFYLPLLKRCEELKKIWDNMREQKEQTPSTHP